MYSKFMRYIDLPWVDLFLDDGPAATVIQGIAQAGL
jgi:hypothetical protein